ncbi:MAG: hypothetical protein M1821_008812 [Bathelium mastoideum]|nr:MAG: hypothetical protein M1821_008812 [Bathelium mastoideum]
MDARQTSSTSFPENSADGAPIMGTTGTSPYLVGFRLWSLVTGLMLAMFLIGLDITVVATAIPRISDYFQSVSDVNWYGSAYLLAV